MTFDTRTYRTTTPAFTLIELLAVIAIIGLLAAVTLFTVSSARGSGRDAAVQQSLNSARSQAENYATGNATAYNGVCTAAQIDNGLADILTSALSSSGASGSITTTLTVAGAYNNVTCHENMTDWVVIAPLHASTASSPQFFCVDAGGISKTTSTVLVAGAVKCP